MAFAPGSVSEGLSGVEDRTHPARCLCPVWRAAGLRPLAPIRTEGWVYSIPGAAPPGAAGGCWTDQRRRCPVCLRLLTDPVRIGSASQTFLEWYGAESTCSRGHGLLQVSEMPASYAAKPEWLALGDSWNDLFPEAAGAQ